MKGFKFFKTVKKTSDDVTFSEVNCSFMFLSIEITIENLLIISATDVDSDNILFQANEKSQALIKLLFYNVFSIF